MRIALISDIHGNVVALDAVLDDCRKQGADHYWFVGDYAAIGPEPSGVLERVAALRHAEFIRGNTDRYVVTGDGPPPALSTVQANPALVPTYAGIAASFAWTRGFLTATGWFDWLARLPLEIRLTGSDGIRMLAVHASPGDDDGEGVHAGRSNEEIERLLESCEADLIIVGHTHEAMVRRVAGRLVVNLGSVSNPLSGDLRASYVLLEIETSGVRFEHRRVGYDHGEFIRRVERSRHPAAAFILSYQHGAHRGRVPHADHTELPAYRTSVQEILRTPSQ